MGILAISKLEAKGDICTRAHAKQFPTLQIWIDKQQDEEKVVALCWKLELFGEIVGDCWCCQWCCH